MTAKQKMIMMDDSSEEDKSKNLVPSSKQSATQTTLKKLYIAYGCKSFENARTLAHRIKSMK